MRDTEAMTKTQSPQFRKTQSGEWVVFGPASQVHVGTVTVAKRDGTTKVENVARVGKTFTVDGVECCYGYVGPAAATKTQAHECDECGRPGASIARRDSS